MPPRKRQKQTGLRRQDAARDRMRVFGFEERVINQSIKQVLEVYGGEENWLLIEDDGSYRPLLETCLAKKEEIDKQLAEGQTSQLLQNQNEEMVENQNQVQAEEGQAKQSAENQNQVQAEEGQPNQSAENHNQAIAEEGQPNESADERQEEKEQEQGMGVNDGRDQADELSFTNEGVIMEPSSSTCPLEGASPDYAPSPVEGFDNLHCGWLSSEEEETDPQEDSDGVDDDEMIQLTPEPLCGELEELLREVPGQNIRKRLTRWDK